MDKYVSLHNHSYFSLLDSQIKPEEMFVTADKNQQKAIAITDHGNGYVIPAASAIAAKTGQKYICGAELYVVDNQKEHIQGEKRNHLLLLAKNQNGYEQLSYMISSGFLEGFYKKPRIDDKVIREIVGGQTNDLICSSACFVAGTQVCTEHGLKNIEEIKAGEKVYTHTGELHTVITPTTRVYNGDIYRIRSFGGIPINCTADHKFLVLKKQTLRMSKNESKFYKEHYQDRTDMQKAMLINKRQHSAQYEMIWQRAKNLEKGDYVLSPLDTTVKDYDAITINGQVVPVTNTLLSLLGLYAVIGNKKDGKIRFAIGADDELAKKEVREYAKDILGEGYFAVTNKSKAGELIYNCPQLNDLFVDDVPDFVKHLPPEKQMYFLRGVLVHSLAQRVNVRTKKAKDIIAFETKNKQFVFNLQMLYNRLYLNPRIDKKETAIEGEYVYKQTITGVVVAKLKDFIFDINKPYQINFAMLAGKFLPIEINGTLYMKHAVKLISIRKYKNLQVHCLNVETDHSMLVEGIVAHNCMAGSIPQYILNGQYEQAVEKAKYYSHMFNGDFYLELQPTQMLEQYIINKALIQMSKELGIPLIATTDAHYVKAEDKETNDVLRCMQGSKTMADPDRWQITGNTYYLMSEKEIREAFTLGFKYHTVRLKNTKKNATSDTYEMNVYDFQEEYGREEQMPNFIEHIKEGTFSYSDLDQNAIDEAITNTVEVADKCNFVLKTGDHYLPHISIPSDDSYNRWLKNFSANNPDKVGEPDANFLRYLCIKGLKAKGLTDKKYRDRLEMELNTINSMGFPSYFLIYYDIANFCHKNNIALGPGRGCFAPHNMVQTTEGYKTIDNINKGDKVICHDGLPHEVIDTHTYAVQEPLVTLQTEDNRIIDGATKDHKILAIKQADWDCGVRTPQWYSAEDIEIGDYIAALD